MNKKLYIFCILVSLIFMSCASNNKQATPYWKHLEPFFINETAHDATVKELNEILVNSTNRINYISLVEKELTRRRISFMDQFRLASLVNLIKDHASSDDVPLINQLIKDGRKHIDFYNLVLDHSPNYITTSLEVFTNKQPLIAHFYTPDGCVLIKSSVQRTFLFELHRATGQKYGESYQDWMLWWEREGKKLNYNDYNHKYEAILPMSTP